MLRPCHGRECQGRRQQTRDEHGCSYARSQMKSDGLGEPDKHGAERRRGGDLDYGERLKSMHLRVMADDHDMNGERYRAQKAQKIAPRHSES